MDMIQLSLLAGLLSGILWVIGDIFLVGFDVDIDRYQDFLASTDIKNKKSAVIPNQKLVVLMLDGSVSRLRFGALVANFSIPLMIFSVWALHQLANPSIWQWLASSLLFIGFSLSPVAHISFYYLGTFCKRLYEGFTAGRVPEDADSKLINEYLKFLNITWVTAVGFSALGWLIYTSQILLGETVFPLFFGILTPLILSPVFQLLVSKIRLFSPYLNEAGLNIGMTLFFVAANIAYAI